MANLAKFRQSSRFGRMSEREGSDESGVFGENGKFGEISPEFKIWENERKRRVGRKRRSRRMSEFIENGEFGEISTEFKIWENERERRVRRKRWIRRKWLIRRKWQIWRNFARVQDLREWAKKKGPTKAANSAKTVRLIPTVLGLPLTFYIECFYLGSIILLIKCLFKKSIHSLLSSSCFENILESEVL